MTSKTAQDLPLNFVQFVYCTSLLILLRYVHQMKHRNNTAQEGTEMKIKKIVYKGITFDSFVGYDRFGDPLGEENDNFKSMPDAFGAYICPVCIKKYKLYQEADTTVADVLYDLEMYGEDGLEGLDMICGVEGCHNGLADDAWLGNDVEVITE